MPIYGYRCGSCGHEFEILQRMSDPPLKTCPKCAGQLSKMVYAAGIIYKGSGYYNTDYKSSSRGSDKTDSNGSGSGSEKSGESKSEGSGVSKSESSGESKSEVSGNSKSESSGDSKPAAPKTESTTTKSDSNS
jgi:putative FmdB family regulatory protein